MNWATFTFLRREAIFKKKRLFLQTSQSQLQEIRHNRERERERERKRDGQDAQVRHGTGNWWQ
jgi:hypothetical protein